MSLPTSPNIFKKYEDNKKGMEKLQKLLEIKGIDICAYAHNFKKNRKNLSSKEESSSL